MKDWPLPWETGSRDGRLAAHVERLRAVHVEAGELCERIERALAAGRLAEGWEMVQELRVLLGRGEDGAS